MNTTTGPAPALSMRSISRDVTATWFPAREIGYKAAASGRAATNQGPAPIVAKAGSFLGILASRELLDVLASGEDSETRTLLRATSPVSRDHPTSETIHDLDQGVEAVAVTDPGGFLVSWVRHRDVLATLS